MSLVVERQRSYGLPRERRSPDACRETRRQGQSTREKVRRQCSANRFPTEGMPTPLPSRATKPRPVATFLPPTVSQGIDQAQGDGQQQGEK
jgi:hypothetical protein